MKLNKYKTKTHLINMILEKKKNIIKKQSVEVEILEYLFILTLFFLSENDQKRNFNFL